MGIVEAKLAGVRIRGCSPVEFEDGSVGTHLLIPSADLKALPPERVAWSSLQPLSELPKPWLDGATGDLRMHWSGHAPSKEGNADAQFVHVCLSGVRIHRATVYGLFDGACGSSIQVEAGDLAVAGKGLCEWDSSKPLVELDRKWPGKTFTAVHTTAAASKEADAKPITPVEEKPLEEIKEVV